MSIERNVTNVLNDLTESIDARTKSEKAEMLEKELYDVNFEMKTGRAAYWALILMYPLSLILLLKVVGKPALKSLLDDIPFQLNVFHYSVIIVTVICMIVPIISFIYLNCRAYPKVSGTILSYKGQEYSYAQITKIHISAVNVATVYVNGRKCFKIAREYVNYQSFIEWARKCNVPIEQTHDDSPEARQKLVVLLTTLIVILCVIGVVAAFAFGVAK